MHNLKFLKGVFFIGYYNFVGGHCLEETPDPFPNSAVKLKDADGTSRVTAWESKLPPTHEALEAIKLRGLLHFR